MHQTSSQILVNPIHWGKDNNIPKKTPKKHIQVVTTASLRRHLFQPLWFVVVVAVVFPGFLPKTNRHSLHSPWFFFAGPFGEISSSNHPFSGAMLVSGRVTDLQVDIHIRAEPFPKNPWLNREFETWANCHSVNVWQMSFSDAWKTFQICQPNRDTSYGWKDQTCLFSEDSSCNCQGKSNCYPPVKAKLDQK